MLFSQISSAQKFPRVQIQQLIDRRAEYTPELLKLIEDPAEIFENAVIRENDMPLWAMVVLGYAAETQAFAPMIRLLEYTDDPMDDFWDDFLIDVVPHILISTYNGDLDSLRRIANHDELDDRYLSVALIALGGICVQGQISRNQFEQEVVEIFHRQVTKTEHDSIFQHVLATTIIDFQIHELRTWVEDTVRLLEEFLYTPKEIKDAFNRTPAQVQQELLQNAEYQRVTNPLGLIEVYWGPVQDYN